MTQEATNLFVYSVKDDDGTAYTLFSVYTVPKNWNHNQTDSWVLANFPPEHCQHSYDCCGNFYGHRAEWSTIKGGAYGVATREILVRRSYTQNI